MKNKRIFAFVMMCVLAFNMTSTIGLANSGEEDLTDNTSNFFYSPEFPDAYIEEVYIPYEDLVLDPVGEIVYINGDENAQNYLQSNPSLSEQLYDDLQNSEEEIVGVVCGTVYVEEVYTETEEGYVCVSSRLLCEEEVGEYDNNTVLATNNLVGTDYADKHKLSLYFTVTDIGHPTGVEYRLTGNAFWSDNTWIENGDSAVTGPGPYSDYIGFYWGGYMGVYNRSITVTDNNGSTNTFGAWDEFSKINASAVWRFTSGLYDPWVSNVMARCNLYKNNLDNEFTEIYCFYVHQYQYGNLTIEFDVKSDGSGCSMTFEGQNNKWHILTKVLGVRY